jgi:uncharacterized membrane protein YccC
MDLSSDGEGSTPWGWISRRFTDLVSDHPRTVLAVKAAVAAGAAWLLVQPLGGVADDYPYYAPLGAVVVMSTAVMTSVRTGLQAVAAIALGAGLALAALQVPGPSVVGVMAVVGVGVGLANWKRLGAMGVWIPFAALFILVLGGRDPGYYVLGYAGLTAFGAVVGVAVNLAAPQLPLGRTLQALTVLRDELTRQLRALADDLSSTEELGTTSDSIGSFVKPRADRLEQLVAEVRESRRVNWRAGRWRHIADRRERQARALETIGYLVQEVGALLIRPTGGMLGGRSEVGDAIAAALESTAAMLEATDFTAEEESTEEESSESPEEVRRSLRHLQQLVLESRSGAEQDAVLVGASVSVSLQRALEAWV